MERRCFLCGESRNLTSLPGDRIPERAPSLILLSTLTRYNVVRLETALSVYRIFDVGNVTVCREHCVQATLYISREIEQLWPDFSQSGVDDAPRSVICALLAHIRMYAAMLDDSVDLTENDVVSFYNNNVNMYYDGTLRKLPLPKQDIHLPSPSKATVANEEFSLPSVFWSSSADLVTVSTDSDTKPIVKTIVSAEEDKGKEHESSASDPQSEGISAASLLEESASFSAQLPRFPCAFCHVRYPSAKLRIVSERVEENVILLCCLIMDNTIEKDVAASIYREICNTNKLICKNHYVQAAWSLGDEVRQVWNRFPVHGLWQVPADIQEDLLKRIQMFARTIKEDITVTLMDLWMFYDFCQSIYNCTENDTMSKTIDELENQCSSSNRHPNSHSISLDDINERSVNKDRTDFFGVNSVNEECSEEKESTVHKRRCILCYRSRQLEELCISSRYLDQRLVLLSCMILDYQTDLEKAKRAYEQMQFGNKFACKRHYVDAAKYLCMEVQRIAGVFPTLGFQRIPAEPKKELMKSINYYSALIDKSVPVSEETVGKFYSDCGTKYHVPGVWKSKTKGATRAQKSAQCTNEKPSSPVIPDSAEVALNEETKRGVKRTVHVSSSEVTTKHTKSTEGEHSIYGDKEPSRRTGRWIIERKPRESPLKKTRCYCGLCGEIRDTRDLRQIKWQPKALVIISCLLAQDIIDIEDATTYYKEQICSGKNRNICDEHLVQAGAFLEAEFRSIMGPKNPRAFIDAPAKVVQTIVERLHSFANRVEKILPLCSEDIRLYLKLYLSKYGESNDWKIRWEPGIKEKIVKKAIPPTKTVQRYEYAHLTPDLKSTRGENCKTKQKYISIFNRSVNNTAISQNQGISDECVDSSPTSKCEIVDSIPECSRVYPPLYECVPTLCAVEPQTAAENGNNYTCGLCGAVGLPMDFRVASVEPQHNIILLSLLLMKNMVDKSRAVVLYNQTQCMRVMICKLHYVRAAARLATEIKKGWGKFPANGLAEVPEKIIYYMLTMLRLYRDFIDPKVDLDQTHMNRFFDDCLERYWVKCKWTPHKKDGCLQQKSTKANNDFQNDSANIMSKKIGGFRQSWSKIGKPDKETPSSFDDCLPLFHTETDEKPTLLDENSPIDLIEAEEDESMPSLSAEKLIEEEPQSEDQENNCAPNLMQDDGEESNFIEHHQEEINVISLLDANCSPSTSAVSKHTPHLEPKLKVKAQVEEENITPDKTADHNSSLHLSEDEIVKFLLKADPSKSISELARELKISSTAVLSYLRCTGTTKEVFRWVPDNSVLQCRLEICSSLVLRNSRDRILDRIVTYGEKWIYFENRNRATLWLDDAEENTNVGSIYGYQPKKVLLSVWWSAAGLIHYHFVEGGKPMTEDKFTRQITEMYRKLKNKQPGLAEIKGPVLLCDNPRPYVSRNSTQKLYQCGFEVLPHPPQSPDLLPSKYHIFRNLNCYLAGKDFHDELDVERAFLSFIASRRSTFYSDGIGELIFRWRKCVTSNGGYFDKS